VGVVEGEEPGPGVALRPGRHHDVALHVEGPLAGALGALEVDQPVVHVVVQLVEGDASVAVEVG